jgi:N-methylhydantoinase A
MWDAIEVGPESAGSDPGPACYGRGGRVPTTTDANLVLGYLDADNYAGGTIKLNLRRAQRAIEQHICEPTGLSVIEAAKAIKRKVDANMAAAIFKEVAVKGYNPKNFVALSYGGGGPLHACGYAAELGIKHVLIPPFSSVFSALGAGNMNQLHIHENSLYLMLYDANTRQLLEDYQVFNDAVAALADKGRDDLLRQGVDPVDIHSRVEVDLRYGNQLTQIGVVCPFDKLTSHRDVIELLDLFSSIYAQRYGEGSQAPEAGVRINVIRVVSYVDHDKLDMQPTHADRRPAPNPTEWRECHYPGIDGAVKTAVFDSAGLDEGHVVEGPAVVETPRTTLLAEPGWQLTIGRTGSAVLTQII